MPIEEFRRVRYTRFYSFDGFEDDDLPKTVRPRKLRKAASWMLDHGFIPRGGQFELGSAHHKYPGFSVGRLSKDLDVNNFRYPEHNRGEVLIGPHVNIGPDGTLTIITREAAISRWVQPIEFPDTEVEPDSSTETETAA